MKSKSKVSKHIKSSSLGPEAYSLPKVTIAPFTYRNDSNTFGFALISPTYGNTSKSSFRESSLDKPDRKLSFLSNLFPNSPKTNKPITLKVESSQKTTISDVSAHRSVYPLSSSHVNKQKMSLKSEVSNKRPNSFIGKRFGSETPPKRNLNLNPLQIIKESETGFLNKKTEDQNVESIQEKAIRIREIEVREAKQGIEQELERKELIIQIYNNLLKLCKGETVYNNQIETCAQEHNIFKEPQGRYEVIYQFEKSIYYNDDSSKKSEQTLPNKENALNSKDQTHSKNSNQQNRVKTITPLTRNKKRKSEYNKSLVSEPNNNVALLKNTPLVRLGESALASTGEELSQSPIIPPIHTSAAFATPNQKIILNNLAERFDNIFTKYEEEKVKLAEKIQELEKKILEIQASQKAEA